MVLFAHLRDGEAEGLYKETRKMAPGRNLANQEPSRGCPSLSLHLQHGKEVLESRGAASPDTNS